MELVVSRPAAAPAGRLPDFPLTTFPYQQHSYSEKPLVATKAKRLVVDQSNRLMLHLKPTDSPTFSSRAVALLMDYAARVGFVQRGLIFHGIAARPQRQAISVLPHTIWKSNHAWNNFILWRLKILIQLLTFLPSCTCYRFDVAREVGESGQVSAICHLLVSPIKLSSIFLLVKLLINCS